MTAARRMDPTDSVCWFGLGLSLALAALVGLNVSVEDRVRQRFAEPKAVVLHAAACGKGDWVCDLDASVLRKGKRFDKQGRVMLAERQK